MEFNATFLVSVISFIIFVFIMNTIFYKPLEKIISEREKLVTDTLNEAKNLKDTSLRLIEEREQKLTDVSIKSKDYLTKKLEEANKNSKEQLVNAKTNSLEKIANGKIAIEKEKKVAKLTIEKHIEDLANEIIKKVTE